MSLIILLCIPLIPAIIVTIYAVVTNKEANKDTKPETAITVDAETANYLAAKAFADHKTPAQIVSEMVQERIAASA